MKIGLQEAYDRILKRIDDGEKIDEQIISLLEGYEKRLKKLEDKNE